MQNPSQTVFHPIDKVRLMLFLRAAPNSRSMGFGNLVAFAVGQSALPGENEHFVAPPEPGAAGLVAWGHALIDWMIGLGAPLALGLVLLALSLAATAYLVVRVAWRFCLVRAWRRRNQKPSW